MNRTSLKRFLRWQAIFASLIAVFPLYRWVIPMISDRLRGCVLLNWFSIYCPLCGGTRAIGALLRFNFVEAFQYNAYVVLMVAVFLVLEIVALIRLLRGHEILLPFPRWCTTVMIVLPFAYAVLRNVLLIAYGYDPTGDLGAFWHP